MKASTSDNFFTLFGIEPNYALNMPALTQRYRALQQQVHPDRYVTMPPHEQRLSAEIAARVNEGYATLKDPILRARYLLELAGINEPDSNPVHESDFLLEQMTLRERLSTIPRLPESAAVVAELLADIKQRNQALQASFTTLYNAHDFSGATLVMHKMCFLAKLLEDATRLEQALLDM